MMKKTMSTMRRTMVAAALVSIAASPVYAGEVKIGVLNGLTGPIPDLSAVILEAELAAAAYINANGGMWEGDTLVVETANFRDERHWIPLGSAPAGTGSSGTMTLVERFTRVDADTLEYEFTVTDPETWTSPWTAPMPMSPTAGPLFEYACHEGNYSMPLMLAGQRTEQKAAAEQP